VEPIREIILLAQTTGPSVGPIWLDGLEANHKWVILGAVVGAWVVLCAWALLSFWRNRQQESRLSALLPASRASDPSGGLSELKGEQAAVSLALADVSAFLAATSSRLSRLQQRLEQQVLRSWQGAQQSGEAFGRMARGLLLLLDHLETAPLETSLPEGHPLLFARARIKSILSEAGIEEIAVGKDQPFDGNWHRLVEQRQSPSPKGTILETVRKGYRFQRAENGHGLLRPAEVIVSTGSESQAPAAASGNSELRKGKRP